MSRALPAAAVVALALTAWLVWPDAPAKWRGLPAPDDPAQTDTNLPRAFRHGAYTVKPLARYSIRAVVLSRERYRYDRGAELAPLDLALGWGPMSIAPVINELKISQSARWFEYSWHGDPPLDPTAIAIHCANTHCVPATDEVRTTLLAIRRHELVELQGYLVEITGADGFRWQSSLSRTDTGGHACELLWVTSATRWSL